MDKRKRRQPKYKLSVDEKGLGVILEYEPGHTAGGVIYEIDDVTFTAEQGRVVFDLLVAGSQPEWNELEPLFDAECRRRGIDSGGPYDTAGEG